MISKRTGKAVKKRLLEIKFPYFAHRHQRTQFLFRSRIKSLAALTSHQIVARGKKTFFELMYKTEADRKSFQNRSDGFLFLLLSNETPDDFNFTTRNSFLPATSKKKVFFKSAHSIHVTIRWDTGGPHDLQKKSRNSCCDGEKKTVPISIPETNDKSITVCSMAFVEKKRAIHCTWVQRSNLSADETFNWRD